MMNRRVLQYVDLLNGRYEYAEYLLYLTDINFFLSVEVYEFNQFDFFFRIHTSFTDVENQIHT